MEEKKFNERLDIDRKMIGVASLFAFLGIGLLLLVVVTTKRMSALRSFNAMQVHWTESRKDAAYNLEKYIDSGNQQDLNALAKAMNVIENSAMVRKRLSDNAFRDIEIQNELTNTQTSAAEMENMISTFEQMQYFEAFRKILNTWEQADSLAYEFYDIASFAATADVNSLSETEAENLKSQVRSIDRQLYGHQYRLASLISQGADLLNKIIVSVAILLGAILLIIALILLFRILTSIKKWSKQVHESKQRYKSLFEQNPNAVYSMDKEGNILKGNQPFQNIFGNGHSGYALSHVSGLLNGNGSNHNKEKIDKVQRGEPLNFEATWTQKAEKQIYLSNTIMPIVVEDELAGIFGIAQDITYKKQTEQKIKEQLEEKTILLAEVHHRVKNNLAMISGMLQLQKRSVEDESALNALEEAKTRIHSMALIHERIYQNDRLANINFQEYIEELAEIIAASRQSDNQEIKMTIDAANLDLTVDQSIPCGLILNELISNAHEHAFKGREKGKIWIKIDQIGNKVHIVVKDNGIGLPGDWDIEDLNSLGMTLVSRLSRQLKGQLSISRKPHTKFEIQFEKEDTPTGHLS